MICIPFRLMERICPLGRMVAVPPPLSDTCRAGAGRFTVLATPPFPPFPRLAPPVLFTADGTPVLPTGPFAFPTLPVPFLAAMPVPVLPEVVVVPVLPTVVPGLVPVVVPGLPPLVDECIAVEDRPFEGREAGALA